MGNIIAHFRGGIKNIIRDAYCPGSNIRLRHIELTG